MSKHTPGPWRFSEGEFFYVNARVDGRRVFILQRKKAVVAAATEYREAEEERIRADCHLIAAAPDLLEALQRLMPTPLTGSPTHAQLVDFWTYEKQQGRGEAADVLFALAAIDKATGESA
jgi:hypothetical protein